MTLIVCKTIGEVVVVYHWEFQVVVLVQHVLFIALMDE